jgi:hypothetical protein
MRGFTAHLRRNLWYALWLAALNLALAFVVFLVLKRVLRIKVPGVTIMARRQHPPGLPMDLANMRRQGVRNLIAYCLNDSCRHQPLIDVSSYPDDVLVSWFRSKVKCAKCGHGGAACRPLRTSAG